MLIHLNLLIISIQNARVFHLHGRMNENINFGMHFFKKHAQFLNVFASVEYQQ